MLFRSRNRGRRGLDILQKIQKMAGVEVIISDLDFPEVKEVDLKLIELARTLEGKIITNDFNLNKVAQLRGVSVLNVNELANSLKPVVLPGEIMKVFILKEGKEYNQGVAYLDDGTMVVVDNARKMISKTIEIVVTSVLQTTAGKMIFGRYIEPGMASQVPASGHAADRPRPANAPAPSVPPQPATGVQAPAVSDSVMDDRLLPAVTVTFSTATPTGSAPATLKMPWPNGGAMATDSGSTVPSGIIVSR